MIDTDVEESLTIYEQACSQCIEDLYHVAYLALVDTDKAEEMVTKVCTAGVRKYADIKDETEIRYYLTDDLYQLCRRRLWFVTPVADKLPEPFQFMTKKERLLAAMWFVSGLSAASAGKIIGMMPDKYRKIISDLMKKMPISI